MIVYALYYSIPYEGSNLEALYAKVEDARAALKSRASDEGHEDKGDDVWDNDYGCSFYITKEEVL